DESTLSFNERVLDMARRANIPLLERLRYLCIVSSNLDEFFEVRVALHLHQIDSKSLAAPYSMHSYQKLSQVANILVEKQYRLFNEELMPALSAQGIRLITFNERTKGQHKWVKHYFDQYVRPLLTPVSLDPSHPFPQVANKSLNFIVRLSGKDAFGRENDIAIVKVPRSLPRVIRLPVPTDSKTIFMVTLSSVIRAHLKDLFPDRVVGQFSQFRVTRDSELLVDEEDAKNLRTALRHGLEHRQFGKPVRLEVSADCSEHLSQFLLQQFKLPAEALYRVDGPVNLVRLTQLIDLANQPALLFPEFQASYPKQLREDESIFKQIKKNDVLIHQPFESFKGVLAFLKEAVDDPKVLAIKQTIYRTGSDSELMDLLREAVIRGKEVTAVVEIKARFDEEANINWAERLESVGAQVVYGVVGLKTHAKMLLVTRREGHKLMRYGHLSTGNYNARTARLYTDISYMTANPDMTADMDAVFTQLASQTRIHRLNHLWLAPFHLQEQLMEMVDKVSKASMHGEPGRIILKMNSLTDEKLARQLVLASQRGVDIDLMVRGACILPAQREGFTDRIKVRSIIGRFLEHSRVYYFRTGDKEHLYLSSADWMNRNMMRRIEIAWPVLDKALRQRIIDECLVAYLFDNTDAWELQVDGSYVRKQPLQTQSHLSAQIELMKKYQQKN
ncbi:MAG: polyphosphate kinase 1, partial [Burkholderiales bacterium]|nr:polyphosphate kinase 1 [Burkholderiales bacterium]